VSDWVLSKFNDNEIDNLESEIFDKTYDLLEEKI
jgi:peptidyl-tRNA hydrolase